MKKFFLILFSLLLVLLLTGCSPNQNRSEPKGEAMFQPSVAGLKAITLDTIEVTDPSLISLLSAELAKAVPSEQAPDNAHPETLTLTVNGREESYQIYIPGLDTAAPAVLKSAEGWYQIPAEFINLLYSLTEYPNYSAAVDAKDKELLAEYGLTPAFLINQLQVKLPTDLLHRAGEYPIILYWAHNNELSQAINLNLEKALGQQVDVRLYKIVELLPDYLSPRCHTGRAVIVHHADKIIGAWLDAGRHYGFACSLDGKTLEEVTNKSWDQWIVSHIDYDDPLEKELALKSPEDIIQTYYAAINNKDDKRAYACLSRENLSSYLFSNLDNYYLMNPEYEAYDGFANITSASVIKIEPYSLNSEQSEELLFYQVTVDLEVKEPMTFESGSQTRFIHLKQESPQTGWRISSIGTGP
ncbi:MAG TPA: DUF4829 domain-containing protein [Oscillospiraceae bacterium]|nr:DUF4829 domain-containing protein [Oscillospiraceae bacterium]